MRTLLRTEAKLYLRDPATVFWGLAFPVLLLVILGSIPSFRDTSADLGGHSVIELYVPIQVAFALTILCVSALPAMLVTDRERGVLRRLATTPVGPGRLLTAQAAVNTVLCAGTIAVVLAAGWIAFGVGLPGQAAGFLLALVLGGAALTAVGLLIAAVAPTARVAAGVGSLLFFPLMFFAGLWVPREALPDLLRHVSDGTPVGALVGALQQASDGAWPGAVHLLVLAGYALVLGFAARRLFRWE